MNRPSLHRRRIVLMRPGSAESVLPDGTCVHPDRAVLAADGEGQADAAGNLLAACGLRFDRAATGGLPQAVQTARRVLRACGASTPLEEDRALHDIRGGRPTELASETAELAFLGAFRPMLDVEAQRLLGGESVGALLDRVLPAFETWLAREDWNCLLLVLDGAVNRALLSSALVGQRAFFGRIEQQPGCINVLDVGSGLGPHGDALVQAINLAPTHWLQARARGATMDELLRQLRHAAIGSVEPAIPR